MNIQPPEIQNSRNFFLQYLKDQLNLGLCYFPVSHILQKGYLGA